MNTGSQITRWMKRGLGFAAVLLAYLLLAKPVEAWADASITFRNGDKEHILTDYYHVSSEQSPFPSENGETKYYHLFNVSDDSESDADLKVRFEKNTYKIDVLRDISLSYNSNNTSRLKIYIMKEMYLEALSLLDQLERYFLMYERRYNLAEAKLLRSIVLYRMSNPMWEQALKAALDMTFEYRFIRIVADQGAAILPLLTEYQRNDKQKSENATMEKMSAKYMGYLHILLQSTKKQAEHYPLYLKDRKRSDINLTEAEKNVLELLVQGLTNKEIADRLFIGIATVKTHTGNIYGKLNARNRAAAIIKAKEYDLLHQSRN